MQPDLQAEFHRAEGHCSFPPVLLFLIPGKVGRQACFPWTLDNYHTPYRKLRVHSQNAQAAVCCSGHHHKGPIKHFAATPGGLSGELPAQCSYKVDASQTPQCSSLPLCCYLFFSTCYHSFWLLSLASECVVCVAVSATGTLLFRTSAYEAWHSGLLPASRYHWGFVSSPPTSLSPLPCTHPTCVAISKSKHHSFF